MKLEQFEPNKGILNESQSCLDYEEDLNYRWEGLWRGGQVMTNQALKKWEIQILQTEFFID